MKIQKIDLYSIYSLDRLGLGGGYLTQIIADETAKSLDKPRKRPAVLVIAGGGYTKVSPREAEPIAFEFLAKGYNAFILDYSVNVQYPNALVEACLAMSYIRDNADQLNVISDKVVAIGFSAGGHLTASLSIIPDEKEVVERLSKNKKFNAKTLAKSVRPNAQILCYPVITGDKTYSHKGSFEVLTCGDNGLIDRLSLEKRVNSSTPPTFIWHTATDQSVPVCNSLILAKALSDNKIPVYLHIFPQGPHGVSLGNEVVTNKPYELSTGVTRWIDECFEFLRDLGFVIKPNEQ